MPELKKKEKPLISLDDERNLAELVLALKRQKLSQPQNSKQQAAERNRRLYSNYNIVEGRKLDQALYRPGPRQFGYTSNHNREEITKQESKTNVSHKEKANAQAKAQAVQECLKHFSFQFPKETKATKIIAYIDLTESEDSRVASEKENFSHNKENIKSRQTVEETKQGQIKPKKPKYRVDHMYFVLDTNVLIQCLYLLEDVVNMVPEDTVGSVLYVPYMVIKELDKLKHKEVSFAARRAIKYLNDKIEEHEKVEAQSAVQDAKQLIDIDCADDSIINCCLQLQKRVPHMMLLTGDNNMRLKAHASFVRVSTCEQLISYRNHWWSLQRDRRQQRVQSKYQTRIWV